MGGEYRVLLSNYADPEQASVTLPSPFNHVGGNFNFEYLTADGQIASLTRTNAQRGVNAAGMLLGGGLYWIRPGASLTPAYAQKYLALYSQNDWRPTAKLTINLGLRYEIQPGPTERFDRMSAWDLDATSPYGTQGAIAFPGVDGYSRNMWDTTYDNFGPRLGAAYQVNDKPSSAAASASPTCRATPASSRARRIMAPRTSPRVCRSCRTARIRAACPWAASRIPCRWRRRSAPTRCAADLRHRRSAVRARLQERALDAVQCVRRADALFDTYLLSIGYSASVSRDLINRAFPVQNLQSVSPDVLADWRDQYIARTAR